MGAVSFSRYGRLHYAEPGALDPLVGDKVLMPTDDGPEVAGCVWAAHWTEADGLPVLVGPAGAAELARVEAFARHKAETRVTTKRLVRERALVTKVVGVDVRNR